MLKIFYILPLLTIVYSNNTIKNFTIYAPTNLKTTTISYTMDTNASTQINIYQNSLQPTLTKEKEQSKRVQNVIITIVAMLTSIIITFSLLCFFRRPIFRLFHSLPTDDY